MADEDFLAPDIATSDLPEMWRRDPNFGLLLAGGQPGQISSYMATRGIAPPGEKEEIADWAGNLPSQGNLMAPARSLKGDLGASPGERTMLAGGALRPAQYSPPAAQLPPSGGPLGGYQYNQPPDMPSPPQVSTVPGGGTYQGPGGRASPAPIPDRTVPAPTERAPDSTRPPVPLPPRRPPETSPDPVRTKGDENIQDDRDAGVEDGDQTRKAQDNRPYSGQRGINMGNILAGVKAMAPGGVAMPSSPAPYRPSQNVRTGQLHQTLNNLVNQALVNRQLRTLGEALRGR